VKEVAVPEGLATRLLEGEDALKEVAEARAVLVKYGDVVKKILAEGAEGEVYVVDGTSVTRLKYSGGELSVAKMDLLEFLKSYNPFEPANYWARRHTVIYMGKRGAEEFYVGSPPGSVRQFLHWLRERVLPEVLPGGEERRLAEAAIREKLEAVERHILEVGLRRLQNVVDVVKSEVSTMVEWMLKDRASGETLAAYLGEAEKVLPVAELRETVRKAIADFLKTEPVDRLERHVAHLAKEWRAPLRRLGIDVEELAREVGASVRLARPQAGLKV